MENEFCKASGSRYCNLVFAVMVFYVVHFQARWSLASSKIRAFSLLQQLSVERIFALSPLIN